jgi:hypothetical protein
MKTGLNFNTGGHLDVRTLSVCNKHQNCTSACMAAKPGSLLYETIRNPNTWKENTCLDLVEMDELTS